MFDDDNVLLIVFKRYFDLGGHHNTRNIHSFVIPKVINEFADKSFRYAILEMMNVSPYDH